MQMVGGNSGNQFRQYVGQNVGNQNGYNAVTSVRNQVVRCSFKGGNFFRWLRMLENQTGLIVVSGIVIRIQNGNGTVQSNWEGMPAYLQTQMLIAQKEEARIQLQAEEFDLMAAVADLDEIKEVNANCILMANLQQASTSGVENTAKTRRPQPRSNAKNDRIPSAFKSSCSKNKEVEVEEHPRNLLLSKNKKNMSLHVINLSLLFGMLNLKLFALCVRQSNVYINANPDVCVLTYVLTMYSVKFLGTIHFGNDHISAILGFGDLQWGNILITRVYFVEGLGHNLFLVWQFCDSDLEVALRRNTCFVWNLEGVDLLKGNRTPNLYTINLHEMASASPICLMAHATSTKSWLWHQRLSHLNFDTINDLAKNDLVIGLPKFKYHKEHLCPSCEQGKSTKGFSPSQTSSILKQRLHLLHMDLCGPIRIASINEKRYVLVIVDDYSRYIWVHFLRSKEEAPEVIKTFLKRITVLLQSPIIIIRTDTTRIHNQILKTTLIVLASLPRIFRQNTLTKWSSGTKKWDVSRGC
ncbi:retrovirus-related pol polyprotein from transposon TNT 1-94 [Tanacetum coccineum]